MITTLEESSLYRIANPRSIVFLGASNNIMSMGTMLLVSTLEQGFKGKIYPVHLKEETVQGIKAYRNVGDLPETPDLAIVVLPTGVVCPILEECGKKGIKQAIIVSGGFKEVGGDGIALEEQLSDIADKYGIRILGPNCLGISNPSWGINTTPMYNESKPGFIGLASQSGSFIAQMYDYLDRFGMGYSTAFSVGNQLNTDLIDCLEYLGACPKTKVIAVYIESINRGQAFIETARSIIPHKPIVALYVGGSETGRRAAFSHTGSMSGPDELYEGVFRQCGIIRAHSITEMFDYCWALGNLPKPKSNRLAILTHSGGPGATAADISGRIGLKLPSFSEETLEALAPYIPSTGNVNNPVDLTFFKNPKDLLFNIPKVLLNDDNVDMLMIYFLTPVNVMKKRMADAGMTAEQIDEFINKIASKNQEMAKTLRETFDKPIIGFTYRDLKENVNRSIIEEGLPVYPSPERAAKSLAALCQYYEYRDKDGC